MGVATVTVNNMVSHSGKVTFAMQVDGDDVGGLHVAFVVQELIVAPAGNGGCGGVNAMEVMLSVIGVVPGT